MNPTAEGALGAGAASGLNVGTIASGANNGLAPDARASDSDGAPGTSTAEVILTRDVDRTTDRPRAWRGAVGFALLAGSFAAMYAAGRYASSVAGPPLGDLLLDRLPTLDVNMLHVYIVTIFWLGVFIYVIRTPGAVPYVTRTFALFICIRAVFTVVTHMGPPPNFLVVPNDVTAIYTFTGDMMFSGHAGAPYLAALIFWDRRIVRTICLIASGAFAVIVMLGALHYTIDVLAAYFITYSIHRLSLVLFRRDHALWRN